MICGKWDYGIDAPEGGKSLLNFSQSQSGMRVLLFVEYQAAAMGGDFINGSGLHRIG